MHFIGFYVTTTFSTHCLAKIYECFECKNISQSAILFLFEIKLTEQNLHCGSTEVSIILRLFENHHVLLLLLPFFFILVQATTKRLCMYIMMKEKTRLLTLYSQTQKHVGGALNVVRNFRNQSTFLEGKKGIFF